MMSPVQVMRVLTNAFAGKYGLWNLHRLAELTAWLSVDVSDNVEGFGDEVRTTFTPNWADITAMLDLKFLHGDKTLEPWAAVEAFAEDEEDRTREAKIEYIEELHHFVEDVLSE